MPCSVDTDAAGVDPHPLELVLPYDSARVDDLPIAARLHLLLREATYEALERNLVSCPAV